MSRQDAATIHPASYAADSQTPASCDPQRFRHAIGHFPTGVAIVTTVDDGKRYGMTASAVTPVSLEPPLLLVCMNRDAPTHAAVRRARRFAVNVLDEDHAHLAERFATPLDDKFSGVDVLDGADGVPLLRPALAHVECEVSQEVPGGTHSIFLAEVRGARSRPGSPLVHFGGAFRRLDPAEARSDEGRLR